MYLLRKSIEQNRESLDNLAIAEDISCKLFPLV